MKNIIASLFILLFLASCNSWLDVQPNDRLSEEAAFSTQSGFERTLNGIYIEMNNRDIYGKELTCGFIEILAQRYAINDEAKTETDIMNLDYSGSSVKGIIASIWEKNYNLIANLNLILKNCDTRKNVLSTKHYQLIKGEALALRAFLHFDLLRLFGPVYKEDSDLLAIPYYNQFQLEKAATLPADSVVNLVVADLKEAAELLEEDPIITYGPRGDISSRFTSDRQLRMNYYAVQALLARVYLYADQKELAYEAAYIVQQAQENWFPWVKPAAISNSVDEPDYMFSTEILFALQNVNKDALYSSLFDASILKAKNILAPRADILSDIFDDRPNDYRLASGFGSQIDLSGTPYRPLLKYKGRDSLYSQMIPLIRMSEVYLILSETAATRSLRSSYFNALRKNRGIPSYSSDPKYEIDKEYIREFFGEGQLFYFYKRTNAASMKSGVELYTDVYVNKSDYILPLPDSETKYN